MGKKKKRRFPKPKKSKKKSKPRNLVDIVIPIYGHPNMLRGTVASLRLHPTTMPWRCVLVDDASPTETRAELDKIYKSLPRDRFRTIKSRENLGYAGANNKGVASGSAPFILLLNSDVRVTGSWLELLVKEMDDSRVGVVGCRLLFFPERFNDHHRPAGRVQHAGVVFNIERAPYHRMIGWPADDVRVMRREEMQGVTGACLLTRRSLWQKIGGLNPIYGTGNFEDMEFCLHVRHLGFKVIYLPDPTIYHFGGGSENYETANRNLMIFRQRCAQAAVFDDYKFGRKE